MAGYFRQRSIDRPSLHEEVRCLLAASSVAAWDLDTKRRILRWAETLVEKDTCWKLHGEIIHRKSVLKRLEGDVKGSCQTLSQHLSMLEAHSHDMAYTDLAPLYLSQASNHVYYFNFPQAHMELKRWMPLASEYLLWDQVLCISRVIRGEGRFQDAKICYEKCLETPQLRRPKRILAKSVLSLTGCPIKY